jgi:hypothetical protein
VVFNKVEKTMNELPLYGYDLFGDPIKPRASGVVFQRFTFPPFTLLDSRQGEWQERKRAWVSLGIKGDDGREDAHCYRGAISEDDFDIERNRKDFVIFVDELDKRRGTNFSETFPELKEFYAKIKNRRTVGILA